ncbi:hypothetical protein Mtc_2066 [Methanocella conradii HZ254]|uniref:Uncharacterized protein n=1 Tax=Methanocella conradii (strain DSM 24694 / JCM 17849 / CGMCC 1.5162 / HZ254) TaxID=1041930 RepID=H8I7D9_METCZ|nr:hypothetical protein [Methanocella conradii]AFD00805.1 hypothetical protein Mtc_2066 [Methanocella conradii HZ254]
MSGVKLPGAIIMILAIAVAGCALPTSTENSDKPLIVATIGPPTPTPTDVPEPTPTWTPTPTPVPPPPPPISIYDVNITGMVDSGSPYFALKHDTAKFRVKNTGNATLEDLIIVYTVAHPVTTSGPASTSTTMVLQQKNESIGKMSPGDVRNIIIKAPDYPAMVEANVTITAMWNGGSLELYSTTLKPGFGNVAPPPNPLPFIA